MFPEKKDNIKINFKEMFPEKKKNAKLNESPLDFSFN